VFIANFGGNTIHKLKMTGVSTSAATTAVSSTLRAMVAVCVEVDWVGLTCPVGFTGEGVRDWVSIVQDASRINKNSAVINLFMVKTPLRFGFKQCLPGF
jgi:hypothetical protein